jgi:signal transduction histidine kinase
MAYLQKFIKPTTTSERWGFTLGLTLLYILAFSPLFYFFGPASGILVIIPVGVIGWYFGTIAGLIAGAIGIVLDGMFFFLFQGFSATSSLIMGLPAYFLVLVAGYAGGQLKKNIAEHDVTRNELMSRDRFLSLMGMATRDILDPLFPDKSYFFLAHHLQNLFVADYAYLTTWDATQGKLNLLVSTQDRENYFTDIVLESSKVSDTSVLVGKKQALVINKKPVSMQVIDLSKLTDLALSDQTELAVPLVAGEYKFGMANLGFETSRVFSREDILYAQLVASQIALALWVAERDNLIKKQLREANALSKIEQTLSKTEQVGLETMLQLIVDSAQELIPAAEQVVLHLLDDPLGLLIPRAVAGPGKQPIKKLSMTKGEGIAGQVIAAGDSISIPDVYKDSRFLQQTTPIKFRSLVVAPIKKSQDDVIGTISIESGRSAAFTPDDCRLLDALGIQAAIAIENADLLEATRKDLQEINALYQISRSLADTLDTDQLMTDVTKLLSDIFGYYHVQIFVADPQSGELVVRQASGENASQIMEAGYRLEIGAGIVAHVAEFGEPVITNNVKDTVFFVPNPFLPDTQSQLTVPIKINSQVVGVLDIQEKLPRQLSQRQMKLMIAVADQLAVALQKANLYEDLQISLHQEQAMRNKLVQSERLTIAGRLLASVSHEMNNPIQTIQNALFLLRDEIGVSDQGKQDLEIVLAESERMAAMLARLRTTYQPVNQNEFQPVQINDLIRDTYALVATHLRHNTISYQFLAASDLPAIQGLENQLKQVIINLVMNAVDAMPEGGQLTLSTQFLPKNDEILVKVADTGTGIKALILPTIFEAFVTTKERGTGLGLAISSEIVLKHHGRIIAENNPGQGATFSIWLPIRSGDQR